jgi:hypothetical protein
VPASTYTHLTPDEQTQLSPPETEPHNSNTSNIVSSIRGSSGVTPLVHGVPASVYTHLTPDEKTQLNPKAQQPAGGDDHHGPNWLEGGSTLRDIVDAGRVVKNGLGALTGAAAAATAHDPHPASVGGHPLPSETVGGSTAKVGKLEGPLAALAVPMGLYTAGAGVNELLHHNLATGASQLVNGAGTAIAGGATLLKAGTDLGSAEVLDGLASGAAGVAGVAQGGLTMYNGFKQGSVQQEVAGGLEAAGGLSMMTGDPVGGAILYGSGLVVQNWGTVSHAASDVGHAASTAAHKVANFFSSVF